MDSLAVGILPLPLFTKCPGLRPQPHFNRGSTLLRHRPWVRGWSDLRGALRPGIDLLTNPCPTDSQIPNKGVRAMSPTTSRPTGSSSWRQMNHEQFDKMKLGRGFIAALDQSGGSTPKALRAYGIDEDRYTDDDEMFALMHMMRSRIIESSRSTATTSSEQSCSRTPWIARSEAEAPCRICGTKSASSRS
jgi:hypothetical protein